MANKAAIAMAGDAGQTIRLAQGLVPDDIAVQVTSSVNDKLDIVIFSLDGREIYRKTAHVQPGTATVHLHTAKLAQSMYFYPERVWQWPQQRAANHRAIAQYNARGQKKAAPFGYALAL